MDTMAIDMDVSGNSAVIIGGRQDCLTLLPGQAFSVDVTARLIPTSNPMTGYSYRLNYDAGALTVVFQDPYYRLAANDGSVLVNTSDPLPDDNSDDDWNAWVEDVGAGVAESDSGILDRLSIEVDPGATAGLYLLTLTNNGHAGQAGPSTPPDATFGASIAVGVPCDSDGDGWNDTTEAVIGTSPDQNCGPLGWPAELKTTAAEINAGTSTLDILDLASFVAPVRRLNTSPGEPGFSRRWDLLPGSMSGKHINISDLGSLVSGPTGFPPMFGGQRAFNNTCAWPVPAAGYRGTSYSPIIAPTAEKPQSKLWFHDGIWWGSLFNSAIREYRIHRLDWSTQAWTDTGVLVDERDTAIADTLWDGIKLYVITAGPNSAVPADEARLRRFSYDAPTDSYSLDPGFPVTIVSGGMEAIVLAKDTTDALWATYTRDSGVWVARSTGSDSIWAAPFPLPALNASNLTADDISSIVAFDSKIGVMWGNQTLGIEAFYFATHTDGDPDADWQSGPALAIPKGADDHINLKALSGDPSGRVFAAIKTSRTPNNGGGPLIMLLVLAPNGSWSSHTVAEVPQDLTRPIVQIDEENRELYVFATAPCCGGGTIYYKQADLDAISFPAGLGTTFMQSAADPCINNASSTKQNHTNATDLVVIAGADCTAFYMHNKIDLP